MLPGLNMMHLGCPEALYADWDSAEHEVVIQLHPDAVCSPLLLIKQTNLYV